MYTKYQLPFGTKLSLLWLFAILNIIFRDIHELTMSNTLEEILSGRLNGVEMSEELLVFGAFIVQLPLLGFLLSNLMQAVAVRRLNLILAPIAIIATILANPSDPDDYIFASIEMITFGIIFFKAWRWPLTSTNEVPSS